MIAEQMRWVIDDTRCCLVPADDSKTVFIYDARKLKNMLGDDYSKYKYYMFDFNGENRYVFVTNMWINFYAFLKKCGEKVTPYFVEGALYDLKEKEFITVPRKIKPARNGVFYEFYLYDAGVPNIIYNREKNIYAIIYHGIGQKSEIAKEILATVSNVCDDGENVEMNRVVFYLKGVKGLSEKRAVVLYDSLRFVKFEKQIEFKECIFGKNLTAREKRVFEIAQRYHGSELYMSEDTYSRISKSKRPSYIISGDSCVISRSPFGIYGELVPICLGAKLLFSYDFGCFAYEIVRDISNPKLENHLILKCSWIRNDFENGESYFDLTEKTVYDTLD